MARREQAEKKLVSAAGAVDPLWSSPRRMIASDVGRMGSKAAIVAVFYSTVSSCDRHHSTSAAAELDLNYNYCLSPKAESPEGGKREGGENFRAPN